MQDDSRPLGGAAPLLEAALRRFSAVGFEGASLQRIAHDAGMSKSSVLYHFGSKEALLDAALRPAIDDLRPLLARLPGMVDDGSRRAFLERLVDHLYAHRLAVAVLINHGRALAGHAVIDEADALVRDLSERLGSTGRDDHESVRFGVALAGAAFVLVAADRWSASPTPDDAVRAVLVDVMGELVLARPVPAA